MDRFISRVNYAKRVLNYVFPSPREVDRFISLGVSASSVNQWSFRPLARWIGLYLLLRTCMGIIQFSFRPLARWIGLYHCVSVDSL